MLKKNKLSTLHLIIILVFSLTPFLWLKPGEVITGHDAGFPLSPWKHFLERTNVWSHRFGLGNDQTTELAGFFIHGFEGLFDFLGFSLTQVQQITFSFYFLLIGVSMYILARELFPQRRNFLPLFAALFYMFNHFILQAWFIVERTKFTLYAALPLILALMFRVSKNKVHPAMAGIYATLVIFFLNGGGFLPLYGAVIIGVLYLLIVLPITGGNKMITLKKLLLFGFVWGVGTLLINAYWILPYFRFLATSFTTEVQAAGGLEGVLAWVNVISLNSSYYNLFRLQGIQEWYVNKYHPYGPVFLNNILLYATSHLLPILAFIPLALSKKKESVIVIIFAGLALFSMIFIAGSHEPFGFIYLWLIQNIPGFLVFRTPFYKFAPALFLCYSVLIAFTLDYFLEKFKNSHLKTALFITAVFFLAIYNYPFFAGNFFEYETGRRTTKVKVPEYILDYAKWSNSNEYPYKRVLLLPGQNPDAHHEAYTWGFWSIAQITGLLDNRSYVGNTLYKSSEEEVFIKNLYELINRGDSSWVDQANFLFIDAVLLRKDFDYKLTESPTINPETLEEFLKTDRRFTKTKDFGPWVIYELKSKPESSFAFKDYYYEIHAENKDKFFEPINLPEIELDSRTVFLEKSVDKFPNRNRGVILIPNCIECNLEGREQFKIDQNQVITSGSIFYNFKLAADKKRYNSARNPEDKLRIASENSLKRLYELRSQFVREGDPKDRTAGWQEFINYLAIQEKAVETYIGLLNNYSIENNKFLILIYENVLQEVDDLKSYVEKISGREEAVYYLKASNQLKKIKKKIEPQIVYSTDNLSKKYLVDIDDQKNVGKYDLYLKKSTSNVFYNNLPVKENIAVLNNKKPSLIAPVNVENSQWYRLGSIELTKGINQLELKEKPILDYIIKDETRLLEYNQNKQCNDFQINRLAVSRYNINIEIASDRKVEDLYIFIDTPEKKREILPYWGRKFELKEEARESYLFNHQNNVEGVYILRLCRINNDKLIDPEMQKSIYLKSLYVERVSSPVIALIKKNETLLQPPTNLQVNTVKEKPSEYELEFVEGGLGDSILMFDQRYDPGWIFEKNDLIAEHFRVHGYANGWRMNKKSGSKEIVKLTFLGQRLYFIGWIITCATLITILIVLMKYKLNLKPKK